MWHTHGLATAAASLGLSSSVAKSTGLHAVDTRFPRQALQFLSVNRNNRPNILKYASVIPNLTALTTSTNGKIRDFASASLSNLNA
jgi:hypothetical protein